MQREERRLHRALPHGRRARRRARRSRCAACEVGPGGGHPAGAGRLGRGRFQRSTAASSCPAKPAVISASASLFGEWSANIISVRAAARRSQRPRARSLESRPRRRRRLARRHPAGHRRSSPRRPAASPATSATSPSGSARRFDSTALKNLQQSVKDLAGISGRLVTFADAQTDPDRPGEPERRHARPTPSPAWRGPSRAPWPGSTPPPATNQLKDILDNGARLERRPARRPRPTCAR